jgi:FkbM family methyltransferase
MYYGQNKEDKILLEYFAGEEPKNLSILDIGANDGITLSNSYAAIQRGWNACLIEPSPSVFAKMKELHKGNDRVHCFEYAISVNDLDNVTFYDSGALLSEKDHALVSSLSSNETSKWRNSGTEYKTISVKTRKFETFLKESPLKTFDAITIDCEGEDLRVLKQINLAGIGCRFLIVEFNGKDETLYRVFAEYMGMRLIHQNAENLIFVK